MAKSSKLALGNRKIFFANVLVIVLFFIAGFSILKNVDNITAKREELEHLKIVEDHLRIRNEELNAKLQMEIDYEYIERIVKEMGYRKPNSVIFHVYSE